MWNDGPIYIKISVIRICSSPGWDPVNQGPPIIKTEKFIQNVISGIVTYQSFITYYPNYVLITPFLLTGILTNVKRKAVDRYEEEN